MKFFESLTALALLTAVPASASAQTRDATARYVGRDGNWFDPANWSTGAVPDAATDVVIGAGASVVIDPARGGAQVQIRDLLVGDRATLTTLPGTVLQTRDERVAPGGRLVYRSSGAIGGTLRYDTATTPCDPQSPLGCVLAPWSGLSLNPTPKQKRIIVLQSSVAVQVGLGGRVPASISQSSDGTVSVRGGADHYSTLTAESIALAGQLSIALHYDFAPVAGDTFRIITATRERTGEFAGLPEGAAVACTADNVGLYISYRGGDGNDVVLTARDTPPATCLLLPAAIRVREIPRPPPPPPPPPPPN